MKALTKIAEPQILVDNSEGWNQEYVTAVVNGVRPTGRWGHPEVRQQLSTETMERCAYCEARVRHVAYDHVEHIRPKSKFPHLSHAWANLTAACPVCNTKKGDYYEPDEPLVNPYEDDPSDHFTWVGPIPWCVDGSDRGYRTIKKLGLDRAQLTADRAQRIKHILELFEVWRQARPGTRQAVEGAIILDWHEGEYPSAVGATLRALGFPLNCPTSE